MTGQIVVIPPPKRPSGWQTQIVCYLHDSIKPLATDSIRWRFVVEDGVPTNTLSDWGFTANCVVPAGERVRVVCEHTRMTGEKHTYETDLIDSPVGDAPVYNYPTKALRIDEPGAIVLYPHIRDYDSPQCILVNAPGVTIIGGELEGANAIQITERGCGTVIAETTVLRTLSYGLCFRKSGVARGTVAIGSYFGPSEHECSVRLTGSAFNTTLVDCVMEGNRSKQGFRATGVPGKYAHLHKCLVTNGGVAVGNFGSHAFEHFRMDRNTVTGDNDAGGSETGGDALIAIKPNAHDIAICSNYLTSDVARLRTISTPSKADKHPFGGALPFGNTLIAHNDITSPRESGAVRANMPDGAPRGTVITQENNLINGQPDHATGTATRGVWIDFDGNPLPENARPGCKQPRPLTKPGTHKSRKMGRN